MTLERVSLADGARVLIRPVVPEDRELLPPALEQLSDRSRYRRFHSPLTRLSPSQLDYLTVLDHHDHEALVAVDDATGDAVGVARFVRLDAELAECAVTVVDAWQNRGLGTLLLDRLVERAREEGVGRFAASVLGENAQALAVLENLGETVRRGGGPAVELEIALPAPGRRGGAHELLRGTARGIVTPALELWRLVVARGAPEGPPGDAIVVPLGSTAALVVARGLAGALGAELHVVGAWWPLVGDRDAAQAALDEAGPRLRTHLEPGSLAEAVLEVAGAIRAGLVVVDAGPSGLDRLADRVSHHAPCNALLVRSAPGG